MKERKKEIMTSKSSIKDRSIHDIYMETPHPLHISQEKRPVADKKGVKDAPPAFNAINTFKSLMDLPFFKFFEDVCVKMSPEYISSLNKDEEEKNDD
jgi:hypothetical protein